MRGLDFALNDICLAVFTTLAPGATLAYVVLACTLLLGKLDSRLRQRIESWLIVPLAVATVGLVASATHLGTPSNALYVFRTVGSSPLATEVFSAVLFLGTSCSYWLGCIYIEGHKALRSLWLLASIAAAVLFIVGTDLAYAMPTVITWDTTLVQVILPCTALACMTPLALLIYTCSGYTSKVRLMRILAGISLAATAASCILMAAQHMELGTQRNAFGTAAELVPLYPAAIALWWRTLEACAPCVHWRRRASPPKRRMKRPMLAEPVGTAVIRQHPPPARPAKTPTLRRHASTPPREPHPIAFRPSNARLFSSSWPCAPSPMPVHSRCASASTASI